MYQLTDALESGFAHTDAEGKQIRIAAGGDIASLPNEVQAELVRSGLAIDPEAPALEPESKESE